ncbi:P12 domain protein, putative [Rhizoctonia solani AG-3 Rhs1AP]|uniref:p12 domain protein, putative n=2 Tax=Rhizoctonia solani AG-3 TaxID=1086053 RepID=X8IZ99_9AGAM|nr:P12 domain protein, putative [Rhizoctonia solani AG-3 Rhs1AP]KEP52013.1 putative P12 domain protein [Rhizoctonia solani 123E]
MTVGAPTSFPPLSTMSYPSLPFPITSYPTSPLWQLTPLSSNSSTGWAPNCTSSDCVPTASWSTSVVNSTLTYTFYAWGHTIYGKVEGDMKLQLIRNGNEESINPSGDILWTFPGLSTDEFLHSNITIKVLEAGNGARLTVNRAFINGSTYGDSDWPTEQWTVPSNDGALKYTGFSQQQATAGLGSPTTYVSSAAGDKVFMKFNGSAVTISGPCGPSNGLMRINLDGSENIINTTKPFQSDDCLLYQSPGFPALNFHTLEIANVDGRTLAFNRLDFFRVLTIATPRGARTNQMGAKIAGIVVAVIVVLAGLIVFYSTRSRRARQKINNSWKVFCG